MAVERLTASLPSGSWFPDQPLIRDFDSEAVNDAHPTTATPPRSTLHEKNPESIGMSDNTVMPIVRVAVLAAGDDGGRLTEMALPSELPLREILPAVERIVRPAGGRRRRERPGPGTAEPRPGRGSAVQPGCHARHRRCGGRGPACAASGSGRSAAPRIVEDIADAAVIFSAARQRPWGAAHIARYAALALDRADPGGHRPGRRPPCA